MKKYTILLITLFFAFQAMSQGNNRMTLLGDRSFDNGDYYLAAEYYKQALNLSNVDKAYVSMKLGECSRQFFDYEEAHKYYKIAYEEAVNTYPTSEYYYGLMLKYNGKYEEAEKLLSSFLEKNPSQNDPKLGKKALLDYNGTILALKVMKQPQRDYNFQNMGRPVNSGYSDFAPVIYDNDSSIFVTSSRIEGSKDKVYGVLGGGFTDNYHFIKHGDKWKLKTHAKDEVFRKVNTEYNDGAGAFTTDKQKYYYTICREHNSSKIETTCAIYVSTIKDSIWGNPEKLNENINPQDEWNAQPTLSATGDTMYFVSKRPGGLGQHDIWYSVKSIEEDWGTAINMGDKVNTPYIDYSPFYYEKEKILFFASDGHEGFGGQDVFMAIGDDFSEIRNLGLPFNSNRDDFYCSLGDKKGYISSNREGGLGHDDVYEFTITSEQSIIAQVNADSTDSKLITIRGIINDEEGNSVEGVEVILADEEGNTLKRTETDITGEFVFANLDPSINYNLYIEEEGSTLFNSNKYELGNVEIFSSEKTDEELAERFSMSENKLKDWNDLSGSTANKLVKGDNVIASETMDVAQAYVPATNSSAQQMTKETYTGSNEGGVVTFDDTDYNRGVRYKKYDGSGHYIVLPKNTLFSISRVTNTSVEDIVRLNKIRNNRIYTGQYLRLSSSSPISSGYDATETSLKVFSEAGVRVQDQYGEIIQIGDEKRYVVKEGDTFWSICTRFGMMLEELRLMNGKSDYLVRPGMALKFDENGKKPHILQNNLENYQAKYKDRITYGEQKEVQEVSEKVEEKEIDKTELIEEIKRDSADTVERVQETIKEQKEEIVEEENSIFEEVDDSIFEEVEE